MPSLSKKIFALDIGTRSIVGIILEEQNKKYIIHDVLIKEHTERAMVDGQIHDVAAVSLVIKQIKSELEAIYGPLKKVSVAAAGRALKTQIGKASLNISGKPILTVEDRLNLELSAVQDAQYQVAENEEIQNTYHYYCVGYSILHYYLDHQEIGSLLNQTGNEAEVKIIATFLPRAVVESLLTALKNANLEMEALTLEPIAAIHVLIPPSMRKLNVALVDIGAGTSDIAITKEGTVIAYGMVPVAGDEVTEALSDHYLLDFPLAEKTKRLMMDQDVITIQDILGFETEIEKGEMVQAIHPIVEKLAESISKEIFGLNNQVSPKAIMLVGGGSLTPGLPEILAKKLNLPANRVAIRGIDAIANLEMLPNIVKGPELVTPIGIAISSTLNPVHYISVEVNQVNVRLFDMKKLTIGDAILAAGLSMNKLYGKPGIAKIVQINGRSITISGTYGKPPVLKKCGIPCQLDDALSAGDRITIEKGEDGQEPTIFVRDFLDDIPKKSISINHEECRIEGMIILNGKKATGDEAIQDRDILTLDFPETVEQVLHFIQLDPILEEIKPFSLTINNEIKTFPNLTGDIYINGKKGYLNSPIEDGDEIILTRRKPIFLETILSSLEYDNTSSIIVFFNGRKICIKTKNQEVYRKGEKLSEDTALLAGDQLSLSKSNVADFIFQDLFRYVDIQIPKNQAGGFTLLRNKQAVTFYEPIFDGDQLELIWMTPEVQNNNPVQK